MTPHLPPFVTSLGPHRERVIRNRVEIAREKYRIVGWANKNDALYQIALSSSAAADRRSHAVARSTSGGRELINPGSGHKRARKCASLNFSRMNHLFPPGHHCPSNSCCSTSPRRGSFKSAGYKTMTYSLPFHRDKIGYLQDPLQEWKNLPYVHQFPFNFQFFVSHAVQTKYLCFVKCDKLLTANKML